MTSPRADRAQLTSSFRLNKYKCESGNGQERERPAADRPAAIFAAPLTPPDTHDAPTPGTDFARRIPPEFVPFEQLLQVPADIASGSRSLPRLTSRLGRSHGHVLKE